MYEITEIWAHLRSLDNAVFEVSALRLRNSYCRLLMRSSSSSVTMNTAIFVPRNMISSPGVLASAFSPENGADELFETAKRTSVHGKKSKWLEVRHDGTIR